MTAFSILDTAANVAAAFDTLNSAGKISAIGFTDSGVPSLSITYAQLVDDTAALALCGGSFVLQVAGAPVSAAATLQADTRITAFSISDTAAHVQDAIDALNGETKISSVAFSDSGTPSVSIAYTQYVDDNATIAKFTGDYGLVVSGASILAAVALQADSRVMEFSITDTASAVQGVLDTLNGDMKLSAISFTDAGTPTLSMTYGQYASEAVGFVLEPIGSPQPMVAWIPLTSKIVGSYQLIVSGAPAWAAPFLQADSRVTSFSVVDTASNINAAIDALNGDSKLSSISFTDAGTPSLTLSYTQYSGDTSALSKFQDNFNLNVSDVPVSAATALQADSRVTSVSISDTADHVAAGLDELNSDSKISTIAFIDSGTPSLSIEVARFLATAFRFR